MMEALRTYLRRLTPARVRRTCLGVLFIGIAVACYRLSLFGVDAFTYMNLGVSGFLHVGFGTWQLLVNLCILAVVFALVAIAVSLDMGTDGLFAIITSAPAWALYGIGALLGAVALAVSVMVSLRALRTAQL